MFKVCESEARSWESRGRNQAPPPTPCSAVAEMIQVSRWRRPQRCRNELLPADATQKETGEFPRGGLRLCHSRDVIAGPAAGFSQLEPRVDVQIPRWSPAPEKKTRDSFCVFWVQTRLNCQQFPAEVPRPPSPRCNSEAPASESSCRTLQNPAELCRTSRLQLRRFWLSFFFSELEQIPLGVLTQNHREEPPIILIFLKNAVFIEFSNVKKTKQFRTQASSSTKR